MNMEWSQIRDERREFIAVNLTPAMSGYFATHYTWSKGEAGVNIRGEAYPEYWFPEPWTSGIGRYRTWQEANAEAAQWGEAEGLPVILATAERVAEAEASSARSAKRMARARELRDQGMSLKDAYAQAQAEENRQ